MREGGVVPGEGVPPRLDEVAVLELIRLPRVRDDLESSPDVVYR